MLKSNNIIFLLSLPRSGSTLLQRLISAHEDISSTSECWFLLPLIYMKKRYGTFSEYGSFEAYKSIEDYIKKYHFSMMAGKNTRYMVLEGARGCEYRCSFCTQWNHWGGMWRTKSIKRIAAEIEYLNETFGGIFLWFTDDHTKLQIRGKKLYNELKHRKCKEDIMLFFQARTDDVAKYPDVIKKLREVGTYWIMCGVETHSKEILDEFKKGTKTPDAYKAMKVLNENDVFSHAMFVIGSRKDTHESIEQLRQFSLDIAPDFTLKPKVSDSVKGCIKYLLNL